MSGWQKQAETGTRPRKWWSQGTSSASSRPCILFDAPFIISKVWRAIRRFSEDIGGLSALPPTRTRAIRARLGMLRITPAQSSETEELARAGFRHRFAPEPSGFTSTTNRYSRRSVSCARRSWSNSARVPRANRTEFCRSCVTPKRTCPILSFHRRTRPSWAERTFWEKATAIHVFCRQEPRRGERLSRHWHDLARLDEAGIAASALADALGLLLLATRPCSSQRTTPAVGSTMKPVSGGLQLVPSGAVYAVLADDY